MIGHRISLQRILFSRKYMYSLLLRKLYPVCILWIQSLTYYLHCDCFTLLICYNGFYYIDILYAGDDHCILLRRKSNPLHMVFHTNYVCRNYVLTHWGRMTPIDRMCRICESRLCAKQWPKTMLAYCHLNPPRQNSVKQESNYETFQPRWSI